MRGKRTAKPHGQIRQSQIITTFGPGAMLDLPKHSVLIAGLEHWLGMGDEIVEPRLTDKLKSLLEVLAIRLYAPPPDPDDLKAPPTGLTVWQFPEWFIVQDVEPADATALWRSRMLVHRRNLTKGRYIDENRKPRPVVSVRFVRGCRCGHVGDIDWYSFARRGAVLGEAKTVKQAELETLMATKVGPDDDRPDGTFYARGIPREKWDAPWMQKMERVVAVHRLREVMALAGFTRFEAASPDIEGELEIGVRRAALAREISWLPAVENRGEGVFLQFKHEEIEAWLQRGEVLDRALRLKAGFECWLHEHQGSHRKFPGLPYVLLHSFSHLLLTAVALECGYPASSIRERIYALPSTGYGILLYTATSDAEGTLGGLVEAGRRVHEHIRAALDSGELCSNDPVCAQHEPQNAHESRFLHGAACHGCLLVAETSCEQHNDFLDRALVVPTVDNLGIEFFSL